MEILVAKSAGFCSGVKKAVDAAYKCAEEGNACTLGQLIHNRIVTGQLEELGVNIIKHPSEAGGRRVIIRSHGVAPDVYAELERVGAEYIDCTCKDVRKVHDIVKEAVAQGKAIVIAGDKSHPEIEAINGIANGSAIVIGSAAAIKADLFDKGKKHLLIAQTTLAVEDFKGIAAELDRLGLDVEVKNTVCAATAVRQNEAANLAKIVDKMIVLGDKKSANSVKLYETCRKYNENVIFIESIKEIQLKFFSESDKIGITAGASTPPVIIKEALQLMSDLENKNDQSFEEMLSESIVSLHTGDVVKGTVIQISNGEISVNLGYKSDGVVSKTEFSEDPDLDPADFVKPGDVIDVFVVHVNDVEGTVLLSKKRVDYLKNAEEIEKAVESKAVLNGKIIESVKGGAIAIINGLRVFVPSSQVSNRYVEDIEAFKGKLLGFNILEYDKAKRKIVAGRRELAAKLVEEQKAKAFESVEVGHKVEGTVSRLTDFGAFIDLGGIDGLVHVSEISWNRIRKPSDILKEGQKVSALIIDINKEKGKISLSIKNITGNPWDTAPEKYAVGMVVQGEVVRMTDFGAFISLEEGIDGLMHISQIAEQRIQKPSEVLSIGEVVTAVVTDLNLETKRVSLSKKQYDRQLAKENGEDGEQAESIPEASDCDAGSCQIDMPEKNQKEDHEDQKEAQEEVQKKVPKKAQKEALEADEFFEKDKTAVEAEEETATEAAEENTESEDKAE